MKKAIDLYSGIGGWTLGLKLAGIEVADSFEWWVEANHTHNMNFNKKLKEVDIRQLHLRALPEPGSVDFIVGSPPCTQFSYANRGGNGDISDGMKDIHKFLEIIEYMNPKYWAMENVPRVAKILEKAIQKGGPLERFKNLITVNEVVDISEYGLPQRRKRMIAGKFPWELFNSYRDKTSPLHLAHVVKAFQEENVIDPIYGYTLSKDMLIDHDMEPPLSMEEERINRDAKTFHPVYNKMAFPDELNRPARTVTALCTRVSRESIIIEDKKKYRRLTIRERGLVQGFPITFQFYGRTYASRIKMIGNAIPPVITYYLAQSFLETPLNKLKLPHQSKYKHKVPSTIPEKVKIDVSGKSYTPIRKFKAAIPNLRFGSGVRFELENVFQDSDFHTWRVNFFFGNSKSIGEIELSHSLCELLLDNISKAGQTEIRKVVEGLRDYLSKTDSYSLQNSWTRRESGISPYDLVDHLGMIALKVIDLLKNEPLRRIQKLIEAIISEEGNFGTAGVANKSISNQPYEVLAGMIIGSWFNEVLAAEYELVETEL